MGSCELCQVGNQAALSSPCPCAGRITCLEFLNLCYAHIALFKAGCVVLCLSLIHISFERTDFSCDRMNAESLEALDRLIEVLEKLRQAFLETQDKQLWI